MKVSLIRILGFALSSAVFAQFNAVIYTFDTFTNVCDGSGGMLQDGQQVVYVYWDANDNGPDAADVLAPDAAQNTFALNGNEYLGVPGAWYSDPAFTYPEFTPAVSKFYVVVVGESARWTSNVYTFASGYSEWDITGHFHCVVTGVPCDETTQVNIETVGGRDFVADGPYYQCIGMCAGTVVEICLGPLAADERPHAVLLPGCVGNGCDSACPSASFSWNLFGWVYNPTNATWCNSATVNGDGCACFGLLDIESAVNIHLVAEAGDGLVWLNWVVASETNLSHYDVLRRTQGADFATIGVVAATNSSSYVFTDTTVTNDTTYEYTLNLVDLDGVVTPLGIIVTARPSGSVSIPSDPARLPSQFALRQNYPNPFNASTSIEYDIVSDYHVALEVRNLLGQTVADLVNGRQAAGRHTVTFDATNLTSGLYFYTVKIGNEFTATKKMLLVK